MRILQYCICTFPLWFLENVSLECRIEKVKVSEQSDHANPKYSNLLLFSFYSSDLFCIPNRAFNNKTWKLVFNGDFTILANSDTTTIHFFKSL